VEVGTVPRRTGVGKSDDRRKHQRRFVKNFTLRRYGRLPSAPTTTHYIILPLRFFILHRYDNLPSLSTTIYYIISTATIFHPYSRSPPTSTKTCNVLFSSQPFFILCRTQKIFAKRNLRHHFILRSSRQFVKNFIRRQYNRFSSTSAKTFYIVFSATIRRTTVNKVRHYFSFNHRKREVLASYLHQEENRRQPLFANPIARLTARFFAIQH